MSHQVIEWLGKRIAQTEKDLERVDSTIQGLEEARVELSERVSGLKISLSDAHKQVLAERGFELTLHKTYYENGYFNIPTRLNEFVGDELSMFLRGPNDSGFFECPAKVGHTSKDGPQRRVFGGALLRDWFQRNYSQDARVPVRAQEPRVLLMGNKAFEDDVEVKGQ